LIAFPTCAQAASRAPLSLEETITKEALAGSIAVPAAVLAAVPAAAQAAARAPPPLEETIADEVVGTIPTAAPGAELAGMPLLIPFQDDDAAGSVMSDVPALCDWENLNADEDNKEDKHEDDAVEEGREEDVQILENLDDHAIKRQVCEAENRQLIESGLALTVGQISHLNRHHGISTHRPHPQAPYVRNPRF
jgi:hypothetical protein